MRLTALGVQVILLGCLPSVAAAAPITLSQIDTLQDVTTGGWFAGGGPFGSVPPVPPHVVATGGPTGAKDASIGDLRRRRAREPFRCDEPVPVGG